MLGLDQPPSALRFCAVEDAGAGPDRGAEWLAAERRRCDVDVRVAAKSLALPGALVGSNERAIAIDGDAHRGGDRATVAPEGGEPDRPCVGEWLEDLGWRWHVRPPSDLPSDRTTRHPSRSVTSSVRRRRRSTRQARQLVRVPDQEDPSHPIVRDLDQHGRRGHAGCVADDDGRATVELADLDGLPGLRAARRGHQEPDHLVGARHREQRGADEAATVGDQLDAGREDPEQAVDVARSTSRRRIAP